ncbi:unnamed protein product [Candidula unifasciata]|uniref:Uncharacterized protein n=1 Tax=Candidula unifasciata TaxID=100452 RepID=A0A8S3ZA78_9EUPU|nr:unnamed protein product [Candidula unifasciata]
MQYNKISNLTGLPQSNKLSILTLNNNHIFDANHLSNVLRPFSDSLNSLSLSFNHLSAIPDLSFLSQLNAYDFSNNQISDPNSGAGSEIVSSADFSYNLLQSVPVIYRSLKSVTIMLLPHNLIHRLQDTDIPYWVVNLDLEYNLITELTDTSFPANSSLLFLTLDNNPIKSISSLAFKNLHSLESLTMQDTKLTRLPLTLAHLTSISYISLSYNPELVCTCLEKGVGKIAPYVDMSGMCGIVSIYNFLVELSPGCPQM